MRHSLAALLIGVFSCSPAIWADTVYKITDPDGKVRYSDTKPETPGNAKVEEVKLPEKGNTINTDANMQQWLQQKETEEQRVARRQADTLEEWQQQYDAAKAALDAAEEALEEGKEPQEGDFVGIANRFGGSAGARPSEEYLERVNGLEEAVQSAREHLSDIEAQKPDISGM